MNSNVRLPEKKLYIILILCAVIIFMNSIEVMMTVKDVELYENWKSELQESEGLAGNDQDYHQGYVTLHLTLFFIKIIIPMILGIYSYFAYVKAGINKIYVYIWSVFLIGSFVINAVQMKFDSVFYYINIVSYIILVITLLSLMDTIKNRGNSQKVGVN